MNMNDVRTLAKNHGVKIPRAAKKAELIQLIQRAEGNWDCFGTAVDGHCDQMGCAWRSDCLGEKPAKKSTSSSATKPRATTAKPRTSATKRSKSRS